MVEFFVIRDLVQVLEQALQKVKIRGGELAEEAPDVRQARLKTINF